jgi:hypothetical protein
MSEPDNEERLRQLKAQADQRRRDYDNAKVQAFALRQRLAENLATLKSGYGCESVAEARQLVEQRQSELTTLLASLEEDLA